MLCSYLIFFMQLGTLHFDGYFLTYIFVLRVLGFFSKLPFFSWVLVFFKKIAHRGIKYLTKTYRTSTISECTLVL